MTGTDAVGTLFTLLVIMSIGGIVGNPTNPLPYVLLAMFVALLVWFLTRVTRGKQHCAVSPGKRPYGRSGATERPRVAPLPTI